MTIVMHEIVTQDKRDMVKFVDISQAGNPNALNRQPFTKKEIEKIWSLVNGNDRMKIPLFLIYTGLRIGEFWNYQKGRCPLGRKMVSGNRIKD